MGGGENNSLHEKTKKSGIVQTKSFKLHYFPNIPVKTFESHKSTTLVDDEIKQGQLPTEGKENGFLADGEKRKNSVSESIDYTARKRIYEEGFGAGEKEGYEKGLSEGEKAGMVLARKEIAQVIKSLKYELENLSDIKNKICKQAEEEVVSLAFAVAEKIISHELAVNEETVLTVVKDALDRVVDYERIMIKVNPVDLNLLEKSIAGLTNHTTKNENITLEGEDSIQSGGCIIETNFGNIDARIGRQLKVIEAAFESEFKKIRIKG